MFDKKLFTTIIASAILIAIAFFAGQWHAKNNMKILPPATTKTGEVIPTKKVEIKTPLKVLDKPSLKQTDAITDAVVKDDSKQVTASSVTKGQEGTKQISAVLDTITGTTNLIQHRPFMEWMNTTEIGIKMGFGTGGIQKGAYLEHTFFRAMDAYAAAEFDVIDRNNTVESIVWIKAAYRFGSK